MAAALAICTEDVQRLTGRYVGREVGDPDILAAATDLRLGGKLESLGNQNRETDRYHGENGLGV